MHRAARTPERLRSLTVAACAVTALVALALPAAADNVSVHDRTGILEADQIPGEVNTDTRVFLNLPHIRQEPELCVPASAAMVLSFFGDPHPPRKLKLLSRGKSGYDPDEPFTDFTFTWWRDLVSGVKQLGYAWSEMAYPNDADGFHTGLAAIKTSLHRGDPVLVDVALYRSHTFVIVGFDEETRRIFIKDPNIRSPGIRALTLEQLESIWNGVSYGLEARPALFTSRKRG